MRNSDLLARIGAGLELMAVLLNMLTAFLWFLSMIWILIGIFWGFAGLVAVAEGALAVFILIKGYSPVGIAGPVVGLMISLVNFQFLAGGMEMLILVLMIVALVMRGQEDAAAGAEA